MKSLALALVLVVAAPLLAGEAGENAKLVQELERTKARFLTSVEGLSEAQWNYKPAPDKWSIAQCAEHIAAAESFIRGAIEKAMATPEAVQEAAVKDEAVLKVTVDRSRKFSSPEPLVPSSRFASPADTMAEFEKQRAETIKLAGNEANFRAHAAQHPGFGMLDAYGWILFLSAHSERHTAQIEEVKQSEGFPKGGM